MKNMLFLALFSLLSSPSALSQEVSVPSTTGNLNMDDPLALDKRYEGVRGSPYVFEKFRKGVLFSSADAPLQLEHLNYNSYARELCYKPSKEEDALVLNKVLIDSFYIQGTEKIWKFARLKLEGISDYGYMEQIFQGEIRLYLNHGKSLNEADYVEPYSSDQRYDEFKDDPVYYIQLEKEGAVLELHKNRKRNADLFKPYQGQMLSFFKSEKIRFKEREDLVKMIQYYMQIKE